MNINSVKILSVSNVINAAMSLILIPLIIRFAGSDEFGFFIFSYTLSIFIYKLTFIQLGRYVLLNFSEDKQGSWYFPLFKLELILGCVSFVLYYLILGVGRFLNFDKFDHSAFNLCGILIMLLTTDVATARLRLFERFHEIAIFNTLPTFLKIAFVAYFQPRNASDVAYVYIYSEFIKYLYLIFVNWKIKSLKDNKKYIVFNKSLWPWLTGLCDLPITYLDSLLIAFALTSEELAAFYILKRIANASGLLFTPITSLLLPGFASKIKNKDINGIKSDIVGVLYYVVPISILIIFSSYFVILYSGDYLFGGVSYLTPELTAGFVFVQMFAFYFIFVHPLLISFGYQKIEFIITLTSNIIYIFMFYQLSIVFSLVGSLCAIFIQYSVTIAMKLYFINKAVKHNKTGSV